MKKRCEVRNYGIGVKKTAVKLVREYATREGEPTWIGDIRQFGGKRWSREKRGERRSNYG